MPNDALRADLGSFLTAHDAELIDFRRDMHAHPELGYHEHRATRQDRAPAGGGGAAADDPAQGDRADRGHR